MRFLLLGVLSLAPLQVASIPVELQHVSPTTTVHEIVKGPPPQYDANLQRRQDDFSWLYSCVFVTPNTGMPTVDEARSLANYLIGLGDSDCVIQRPFYNHDRSTQTLVSTGITRANFYFTPEAGDVGKATQYCNKLGEYFNALINVCQRDGKVQGSTNIPNCPNKGIEWPSTSTLSESPGLAIEIVPL